MTVGMRGGLLGHRSAAPTNVTLHTAPTEALNTETNASSYTVTLSGLPAGDKVVLVFFHSDLVFATGPSISSVSSTDGTATLISGTGSGNTGSKLGVFKVIGATSTSFDVTVTYSATVESGYIAYAVLTNTSQTSHYSLSNAVPESAGGGTNPLVLTSIDIPTGGVGFVWGLVLSTTTLSCSQASGSGSQDLNATNGGCRVLAYHSTSAVSTTFSLTSGTSTGKHGVAVSWGL